MVDKSDNIYFKRDPEKFEQLAKLVEDFSVSYSRKLLAKGKKRERKNPYAGLVCLRAWVEEQTPLLSDTIYDIKTKVAWILHGIEDFPKCEGCGSQEKYKGLNVQVNRFYNRFCSLKCSSNAESVKAEIQSTKVSRYGEHQEAITAKSKATVARKIKANPDYWKDRQKKTAATCMRKYGAEHNMKSEVGLNEYCDAMLKKHGVMFPQQSAEIRETTIKNNLAVYGKEWYVQTDEFKEKFCQASREKYGTDYPAQSHEFMAKVRAGYAYKGLNFKTGPELAYYIWLEDSNADFEYQPCGFAYEYNGKTHSYIPDFKVGGQYFEIKGDQFLKEDGTWQNPFDHSQDGLYEAKHQCALRNGVCIMYRDQYAKYEEYVDSKYGKDYLTRFRVSAASKIVGTAGSLLNGAANMLNI